MDITKAYAASGILSIVPASSRAGVSRQIAKLEMMLADAMKSRSIEEGHVQRLPVTIAMRTNKPRLSEVKRSHKRKSPV